MRTVTAAVAALVALAATGLAGEGGGYGNAGLDGEYFANPDLKAPAAFTRRDVRIDFDLAGNASIAGSVAEPYRSFPREGYSVRWTGRLIPRFDEPYTFAAESDAGVRVRVRPAGAAEWTAVVDAWDTPRAIERGRPFAMNAGAAYDVQVEMRHRRGAARCAIKWASPSTPEEVVDSLGGNALNLASWHGYCCADKVKEGRWYHDKNLDADGWPTADHDFIVVEGHKSMQGTYLLSFTGQARVEAWGTPSRFLVEGVEPGRPLPRGTGYDAASNTTQARFTIDAESGIFILKFRESMRTAASPTNSGLAHLRILRPVAPGSETPHNADEVCYRPMKEAVKAFTCLRWLGMANARMPGDWAHRTEAGCRYFCGPESEGSPDQGENWEQLVLMANETGRDLYLCTPVAADNDYFRKLALLLRYGSDGVEPYSSHQADPKYPPLNSNLRVYLEVGNEIWNWSFGSTQQAQAQAWEEVQKQTEDGKVVNYDGKAGQGIDAMRRWHALRTVRASRIFREVFGDAAMGRRIRPLIEFQYANAQSTAWLSFRFLDGYFNNADGDHVKDPHPPRYDIWGAGGASYFGVGNPDGLQDDIKVPDNSFEKVAVADGAVSTNAAGTVWTFKGGAGIFRNLTSAVADYTAGKNMRQPSGVALGFKFRTGPDALYVYQFGRVFEQGSEGATIRLLEAATRRVVVEAGTGKAQAYLTKIFGNYFAKRFEKPIRLEPNADYYLMSSDLGQTNLRDANTVAVPGAGLTILGAARAEGGGDPAQWTFKDTGGTNTVYGPVTFLYSTRSDLNPVYPQPPFGQQAVVIRGNGEFSGVMNFPKAGAYALNFNSVGCGEWGQFFDAYVDEQRISPLSTADFRVPPGVPTQDEQTGFGTGGWGRNNGFKEEWGSAPFTVAAGPHAIRVVARQVSHARNKNLWTVFDNMTVSSVDAIMTSGFGSGSALGQPAENKWADAQALDSTFGLSLGLPRVSYESGWSLGGDFYQKPIHNYCKFMDDRAQAINDKAIELFAGSGGALNVWGVYIYWPPYDFARTGEYPIMRSIIAANNRLPVEPRTGPVIPADLAVTNSIKWNWDMDIKAPLKTRGAWRAWVFTAPRAGDVEILPFITGTGSCEVEVDGQPLGRVEAGAEPGPPLTAWLTRGSHGLRVRNLGGEFAVEKVILRPLRP